MKTILFETIDGHEIVTGSSVPTVDGVETNKVVMGYTDDQGKRQPGAIEATSEYQAVQAKKAEFMSAAKDRAAAVKTRDKVKFKTALESMQRAQDEAIPLAKAMNDKIMELRRDKAVYFEPKLGEAITPAAEVDGLIQAIKNKPDGVFITRDGNQVPENRGKVYFRKVSGTWQRTRIVKLGDTVPSDAVLAEDLTPEQRNEVNRDRVAALPTEVRTREKDKALGALLNSAADMKARLEIQSDPDALQKSKDYYDAELVRIKEIYGA